VIGDVLALRRDELIGHVLKDDRWQADCRQHRPHLLFGE
jgi:hypothetical protein